MKLPFLSIWAEPGAKRELEVIESGYIHYKKAEIHDVSVNLIENTAILLNNITMHSVVNEVEVVNNFMVTEVYIQKDNNWNLGSLSFTKLI